jgi:hypothetical protein
METGTQILIERMKTHPEEFVEGMHSKWSHVMQLANDCLPDEDKAALKKTYTQAKIERFNGEVLATLAGEREQLGVIAESSLKYKAQERYSTGFTDPRGLFGQAAAQGLTTTVGSNGTSAVGISDWLTGGSK